MPKSKVSNEEWERVIKQVEANTCFRLSAGVSDSSAFMVPVASNGIVIGDCQRFTWRQLKTLAALGPAPHLK